MTAGPLLDANALIALVVVEHEHHDRVSAWAAGVDKLAVCPVTEGAMVRYLIRVGETSAASSSLLTALHKAPKIEFWPDSLSYADASLGHVRGHRQVTDAYLASLAASREARLATLDEALAAENPERVVLIRSDR